MTKKDKKSSEKIVRFTASHAQNPEELIKKIIKANKRTMDYLATR